MFSITVFTYGIPHETVFNTFNRIEIIIYFSAQKGLFMSDEERMSDSMTSDDASNSHFGDDKLKNWKEYNEKKVTILNTDYCQT